MSDGPYAGWYKYTYDVTWTGGKKEGLSRLDLLLTGCLAEDGSIGFDSGVGGHDGISTDEHGSGFDLPYLAALSLRGDPSIDLPDPVIKWEPVGRRDPGQSGSGLFWFYSDAAPVYTGYDGAGLIVAKQGHDATYGDITGAYPGCFEAPEPCSAGVPEPATVTLLVLGGVLALVRRARR